MLSTLEPFVLFILPKYTHLSLDFLCSLNVLEHQQHTSLDTSRSTQFFINVHTLDHRHQHTRHNAWTGKREFERVRGVLLSTASSASRSHGPPTTEGLPHQQPYTLKAKGRYDLHATGGGYNHHKPGWRFHRLNTTKPRQHGMPVTRGRDVYEGVPQSHPEASGTGTPQAA